MFEPHDPLTKFRGSLALKPANVQFEWTPERLSEFQKCSEDPIYFAKNYCKIIHVDRGLIPFELYDFQEELILSVKDNRFTVAEFGRQQGKSSTVSAMVCWYALFHEHQKIAILANTVDIAQTMLARVQVMYMNLPKWLSQGCLDWNKRSFSLENGSEIFAAASTARSIAGKSVTLLVCDEAAHIDNWDEFWGSVYPTISSGKTTKVVLMSSVMGLNHFYQITQGARKGTNDYHLISVPWQRVPGRDQAWKQETLKAMNFDEAQFAREFENEYQGSSGTLIAGWKLKQLEALNAIRSNQSLIEYFEPDPAKSYVVVADTSRGKGLDYSAFSVFDVSKMPYEQVCVFRDNITSPYDYAEIIYRVAKSYFNAMVLVEINDIGQQVADYIFDNYDYEYLFYTESAGRAGKRLSDGGIQCDRGVRTTTQVKATGCAILKLLIEQDQLLIHDGHTIAELSTFSKNKKSYEAEPGNNDDLVMGLVLFAWLSDQELFKYQTDINTLANLREKNESSMMNDLMPFGFINNGQSPDTIERDPGDVFEGTWMWPPDEKHNNW